MAEQHAYSGIFHRILAYFLDGLILMAVAVGVPFLLPDDRMGVYIETVLLTLIGVGYYVGFESQWSASPGKKIMGLKLLTKDFEPVTLAHILKRRALPFSLTLVGVVAQLVAISSIPDDVVAGLAGGMFDPKKVEATQAMVAANPLGFFAYLFTGLAFLEGMYFLVNRRRQAIHDLIAGTIVVHK